MDEEDIGVFMLLIYVIKVICQHESIFMGLLLMYEKG